MGASENKLVDMPGIARLLRVASKTPQQWRQRGVLPKEDEYYSGKPLWRVSTIIRWAKDTNRWPPGRAAERAPRSAARN